MSSPLPTCWSSPKQREWSVRKQRNLSDSSFIWSFSPLRIDLAYACRSGIWNWIFQWLGKNLILKRRFARRCGIKGIGFQSPYNGSQREVIHSALLVAFYRCLLEEAIAPREGWYKPAMAAFMMFTLTSAHFLTKHGLLLLSFCKGWLNNRGKGHLPRFLPC